MSNPNFVPLTSTNEVYRDTDTAICLTDLLDGYDGDIEALQASVSGLGTTYASINHTHSEYADSDDISALQTAIAGKANASHTHSEYDYDSEITALQSSVASKADASHTHSGYAAVGHTHTGYATTSDISALQEEVDGKAASGHTHSNYASVNHNHDSAYSAIGHTHANYATDEELTALQTAVSGKADANHTHTQYASASHTHSNYATTNAVDALETALDGKADSSHTHSNYASASHNHDSSYAAIGHSHSGYATDDDVSALETALASKADAGHTHSNYAASSHNHDSSYYTKSSMDSKLSAKADSSTVTSHTGNADVHVTTTNKGNWDAAYAHSQSAHYSHPTTSGNKHVPSGGASGNVLCWSADGTAAWGTEKYGDRIATTTGTGEAYVASVEGITALTAGASFIMIPHVTPTKVNPTLDVNGLGAKNLRMRVSNSTVTTTPLSTTNLVYAGKPTRVMYDGTQWVIDIVRPNVTNLYGTVAITQGGTGANTAEKARTNLEVYSKAEVDALVAQAIANL